MKRATLLLLVIIFGAILSATSSPRLAGDFNEPAYETICDNSLSVLATIPPDLSAEGKSFCCRDDEKTVFKSAVSYFLEKFENSPPV